MYTLQDIKNSLPEEKRHSDGLYTRAVLRPLSVPVVWLALRMKLSANTVSYLSAVFSISGGVLFALPGFWVPLWGAILLNIFAVLDCVDGGIARVTKTTSAWGNWADAVMGFVAYTAVFIGSGMYLFLRTDWWWMLLITSLTSSANLLTRAAFQFYKNIVGTSQARHSVAFEQKFADTVGITGFKMPLLIVFHLLSKFGEETASIGFWGIMLIIVFNAGFYIGGCGYTIVKLALKSHTSEKTGAMAEE
jgi:phosphatidylglycerophosphate synthase